MRPSSGPAAVEFRKVFWMPKDKGGAGLSLSIPTGQILALAAADDTPVLRLIQRAVPPQAGSICLFGRDLWLMSAADVAGLIATVRKEQPSDATLTVRQSVTMARLAWRAGAGQDDDRQDGDRVRMALLRADLDTLTHRTLGALSPGERHRVMFARALVQEPKVLLMQQAAEGRTQRDLMAVARGLGLTVLVLTDPASATDWADRKVVLPGSRALPEVPVPCPSDAPKRRPVPLAAPAARHHDLPLSL